MYKNVQKATRATIEQWISLGKGSQVDGKVLRVILLLCSGQIFLQSRKRSMYFGNACVFLFILVFFSLYFLFWGTCVRFLKIGIRSVLFQDRQVSLFVTRHFILFIYF